jgi:hypothetical protein
MTHRICLTLLALAWTLSVAAAADPATGPATTAPPAQPATATAPARIYLGLYLDEGVAFDGAAPQVAKVVTGATADQLGVRPGDRISTVNGIATPDLDRFRAAVAGLAPGDALVLGVVRAGVALELRGTAEAPPRPRDVLTDADDLRAEVQRLRDEAERVRLRSRLEEQLRLLREVEAGLPAAAADFKRLYPDGTFEISVRIDIRSNPRAEAQVPLQPARTTTSATAAGPATTASPR